MNRSRPRTQHRLWAIVAALLLVTVAIKALSQAEEPSTTPAFQSFKTSDTMPAALDKAKLDHVIDGTTLGAIVDELGPGWMSPLESAGIIRWFFNDNRELCILPERYESEEIISKKGDHGRARMWIEGARPAHPSTAPSTTRSS